MGRCLYVTSAKTIENRPETRVICTCKNASSNIMWVHADNIYHTPLKNAYAAYAWESAIKEMVDAFFLCVWPIKMSGKASKHLRLYWSPPLPCVWVALFCDWCAFFFSPGAVPLCQQEAESQVLCLCVNRKQRAR